MMIAIVALHGIFVCLDMYGETFTIVGCPPTCSGVDVRLLTASLSPSLHIYKRAPEWLEAYYRSCNAVWLLYCGLSIQGGLSSQNHNEYHRSSITPPEITRTSAFPVEVLAAYCGQASNCTKATYSSSSIYRSTRQKYWLVLCSSAGP
jgi:hypothetical protein